MRWKARRLGAWAAPLLTLTLLLSAGPLPRAQGRPAEPAQAPPLQLYLPLLAAPQGTGRAPTGSTQSDQALIAAALAAGTIDYGTSLLYRAYALFADPRLPAQLQGAGSEGEDHGLFKAMADPSLPAATQAALRPFLVRPGHPESVHNRPAAAPAALAASEIWCDPGTGWGSLRSSRPEVAATVHGACLLPEAVADMRKTLAIIESLWAPMTGLMREPIGDVGGEPGSPDDTIDFYLMEPLGKVWREGEIGISDDAMHSTVSTKPFFADRSSAFVLLARSDVSSKTFKSSVAHEFFHVIQNAYNDTISSSDGKTWWFAEASAVWAESHFVRETSREGAHGLFPEVFLPSRESLHRSYGWENSAANQKARLQMYAGYVWPLFVEQEKGAAAIARIWDKLSAAGGSWDLGLRAIESELSFKDHFHRFALRNLNSAFYLDNPLGKRYVHLDPGFYDEAMPKPEQTDMLLAQESDAPPLKLPVAIPSLKAHYYHYTIADSVQQVRFDFSDITSTANRTISAVVKLKGKPWEVRERLPDILNFCIEEEPLEDIWFVVSNHDTTIDSSVSGELLIRPLGTPCGCSQELEDEIRSVKQWQGRVEFSYSASAANSRWDIKQQRTGAITVTLNLRTPDGSAFLGSPGGTVVIDDTKFMLQPNKPPTLMAAFKGTTIPVPYDAAANSYSRVGLAFDFEDCTYRWGSTTYLEATFSDWESSSMTRVINGSLESGALPIIGLNLTDSRSFPARTTEYILKHDEAFYEQTDPDLVDILGEEGLGAATVRWTFIPVR